MNLLIGQYLSNTNESATVLKSKIILHLNKAVYALASMMMIALAS
jgi:hypothetical protein